MMVNISFSIFKKNKIELLSNSRTMKVDNKDIYYDMLGSQLEIFTFDNNISLISEIIAFCKDRNLMDPEKVEEELSVNFTKRFLNIKIKHIKYIKVFSLRTNEKIFKEKFPEYFI